MVLNAAKTKVMIFGNIDEEVKITIEGSVVEKVNSYKYLGVIQDVNLDFGLQVEHAVANARRASAKISSLIDGHNGLPVHIGIDLYKVLVRLHLEYALPIWASICNEDLRIVLLRYPKPTPKSRFFAKTVCRRNLGFVCHN